MALVGKLLRRFRAGAHRSPLGAAELDAPDTITVTSSAFADGAAIPRAHAGQKVGDNTSPPLQWTGVPASAQQVAVIVEDIDVPAPKALLHTIALVDPQRTGLEAGEMQAGKVRFIKAFGDSYVGPAPIPGHGPHHYRFHVLALDQPTADDVADHNAFLGAIAGHVVARGVLTGTYER